MRLLSITSCGNILNCVRGRQYLGQLLATLNAIPILIGAPLTAVLRGPKFRVSVRRSNNKPKPRDNVAVVRKTTTCSNKQQQQHGKTATAADRKLDWAGCRGSNNLILHCKCKQISASRSCEKK